MWNIKDIPGWSAFENDILKGVSNNNRNSSTNRNNNRNSSTNRNNNRNSSTNRNSNTNGNNNINSVVILGKRYNIYTIYLDLHGNNLTKLQESIGRLTNLEVLDLSYNKLTSLPERIGLLKKLWYIDLRDNKLTFLPNWIGRIENLERLDLHGNNLTKLQESFGQLTNLEILDLSFNNLTKLPESIGNLTNLETLDLNGNKLKSLPESIGKLTKLKELTLYGNKLISLPKSFKNLDRNLRIYYEGQKYNRDEFINLYGILYGIVDKNVYLRNIINIRLRNSSLNNFENTVERIKTNLPLKVSRNDVNTILRSMKPQVLQKIFNKLNNSPSNNRVRIMNTMKNGGFMNQNDINVMKKKLLGSNASFPYYKKPLLPNIRTGNSYLSLVYTRLRKSSLNNFENTVERLKTNLPPNVNLSRNDVNNIARSMKPQVLQKIFNKLKNSPSNKRNSIMNTMKNRGFMNQNDINNALKKLNISSTSKK